MYTLFFVKEKREMSSDYISCDKLSSPHFLIVSYIILRILYSIACYSYACSSNNGYTKRFNKCVHETLKRGRHRRVGAPPCEAYVTSLV